MHMDKQEVFNKIVTFLYKQGGKSYDDSVGMCLYRGPNGTKCAIGCLIEDEHYNINLEGREIEWGNDVHAALEKSLDCKISHEDITLLLLMQMIHDDWNQDTPFPFNSFRYTADTLGVSMPTLD